MFWLISLWLLILIVIIGPYFIPIDILTAAVADEFLEQEWTMKSIIKVENQLEEDILMELLTEQYAIELETSLDPQNQSGYALIKFSDEHNKGELMEVKVVLRDQTLWMKPSILGQTYKLDIEDEWDFLVDVKEVHEKLEFQEKTKYEEVEVSRGDRRFKCWARVITSTYAVGEYGGTMEIYYIPYMGIQKILNTINLNDVTHVNIESRLEEVDVDLSDMNMKNPINLDALDIFDLVANTQQE